MVISFNQLLQNFNSVPHLYEKFTNLIALNLLCVTVGCVTFSRFWREALHKSVCYIYGRVTSHASEEMLYINLCFTVTHCHYLQLEPSGLPTSTSSCASVPATVATVGDRSTSSSPSSVTASSSAVRSSRCAAAPHRVATGARKRKTSSERSQERSGWWQGHRSETTWQRWRQISSDRDVARGMRSSRYR